MTSAFASIEQPRSTVLTITHSPIKEVWGALAERLPQPPIPQPVALVAIDGRVLREVMDITRP